MLLRHRADLLWNRRLPNMPTRELLLAEARNMFPKTISLDDIVDGAYQLLIEAVGALLIAPLWATATPKPQANMDWPRPHPAKRDNRISEITPP